MVDESCPVSIAFGRNCSNRLKIFIMDEITILGITSVGSVSNLSDEFAEDLSSFVVSKSPNSNSLLRIVNELNQLS